VSGALISLQLEEKEKRKRRERTIPVRGWGSSLLFDRVENNINPKRNLNI